jgi:ATP-dependent RNA helicase DDX55/SPB4
MGFGESMGLCPLTCIGSFKTNVCTLQLELPKMPEIKKLGLDRSLGLGIDTSAIVFLDKAREKKRQETMAERRSTASADKAKRIAQKKRNEAWSNKHDREDLQEARRDRRKHRMEAKRVANMTAEQLEEKRQLDVLIEKVRHQHSQGAAMDFEGFAD